MMIVEMLSKGMISIEISKLSFFAMNKNGHVTLFLHTMC